MTPQATPAGLLDLAVMHLSACYRRIVPRDALCRVLALTSVNADVTAILTYLSIQLDAALIIRCVSAISAGLARAGSSLTKKRSRKSCFIAARC